MGFRGLRGPGWHTGRRCGAARARGCLLNSLHAEAYVSDPIFHFSFHFNLISTYQYITVHNTTHRQPLSLLLLASPPLLASSVAPAAPSLSYFPSDSLASPLPLYFSFRRPDGVASFGVASLVLFGRLLSPFSLLVNSLVLLSLFSLASLAS